jgi:hypothetical protein
LCGFPFANVDSHRRVRVAIVCAASSAAFGELGGLCMLQQWKKAVIVCDFQLSLDVCHDYRL